MTEFYAENGPIQHDKHLDEDQGFSPCEYILIILSYMLLIIGFPFAIFFCLRVVKVYERAVQLRLGKRLKRKNRSVLGAGIQIVLPCIDDLLKIDLRTHAINIPPQEVLTADAVTVSVDAVVYMHVMEADSALLRVKYPFESAELLAVSLLRTVLGSYDLSQVLSSREQIDSKLQSMLDAATDAWGIDVERVEIKDVSLPQDMQRAMAAEAEATRAARAKIVTAKGELDASTTLKLAAMEMETCPAALQLRYLQTLTSIASEQNSTILFPMPIDILSAFNPKKRD